MGGHNSYYTLSTALRVILFRKKKKKTLNLGENNIRKYVFPRFPFILFFRMLKEEIQIIAVAHAKRRPGYWKSR